MSDEIPAWALEAAERIVYPLIPRSPTVDEVARIIAEACQQHLVHHDTELRERCASIAQSRCSGPLSHSTWCGCEIAAEIRRKKERK